MNRIITLTVPKASPSLNSTTRKHWSAYYRQKKLWQKLLWVAKAEAGIYGMPMFERSRIHVERYGAKILDDDNATGGLKGPIDCLKTLGLIVDDSPAHITLTLEQKVSTEPRTVIRIEQISTNLGDNQ